MPQTKKWKPLDSEESSSTTMLKCMKMLHYKKKLVLNHFVYLNFMPFPHHWMFWKILNVKQAVELLYI